MYRKFFALEGGWASIFALYMIILMMVIGGVSVDMTRANRDKTMLHSVTDSAALAAAQFLPDTAQARTAALAYLNRHLPSETYGNVVLEDDIIFGRWNKDSRTLHPGDVDSDAVMVRGRFSFDEAYQSGRRHLLLGMFGADTWNIEVVSVATRHGSTEECHGEPLLGNLTDYLFFIGDGRNDANWQSSSKGYSGNIAVNGLLASERSSGNLYYSGTIHTNRNQLGAYQRHVDGNPATSSVMVNQTSLIDTLQNEFDAAIAVISALPTTPGFTSVDARDLDGLDVQDGEGNLYVIDVTAGFSSSKPVNIYGDHDDLFILRWDTKPDEEGYHGTVKLSGGGGINPLGALTPSNFVHVAGGLDSSGGGSTPSGLQPYLSELPDTVSGGGFFTGYWLTTGRPDKNFESSSFSNAIFVGGWYTTARKFSMTSGTSAVHVAPVVKPALDDCTPGGPLKQVMGTSLVY